MAKNSVVIIGKSRLAEELLELGRKKGFDATIQTGREKIPDSTSFAIETLTSDEQEKKNALKSIDAHAPQSALILTSCLGFATSQIASWTTKPERVVGFATFFPIKGKKVIELSAGLKTQQRAMNEAEAFFRALGKETVWVKDAPGLVFPRILSLIINEAARSLDEGVAQTEEVDTAMRLGTNYPLGPLRWADQVGLDEVLAVLEGLQRETGDDRYRPASLLRKMVLSGWLGEKSGRGFYSYRSEA